MRCTLRWLLLVCLVIQRPMAAEVPKPAHDLGLRIEATSPASGEKLAPGKEPETFHFVYHGQVWFSSRSMFPVAISISSAGTVVAEHTVADDKPFTIEADLRPGSYTLHSEPASKEARETYWGAFGPAIQIGSDGKLTHLTHQVITHDLKIKILEPQMLAKVEAKRPVLRWEAVVGAAQYQVSWFEQVLPDRKVVKTVQGLKANATQYAFEEGVVPKRLYEWDVCATDAAGNQLAHGNSYFLTPGIDVKDLKRPIAPPPPPAGSGWLGVSLQEQHAVIADVLNSKPGLVVIDVLPDSPAVTAGLRAQDVIVKVDDRPVAATLQEFISGIAGRMPGTSVQLTMWRDMQETTVAVVVGKRPASTQAATQPRRTP